MKIRIVFLALLIPIACSAQIHEWSKEPSLGFYYTPLKINRHSRSSGIAPDEYYFENSANISGSVPLSQRLRIGIQYISVANKVIRKPVDRSYLFGLFGQYNFSAQKRLGVYLEGGYSRGNLCPCGDAESYTSDTINHFVAAGIGFDFKLTDRFHLKAGFIDYEPIKKQNGIYNWTQPFLGVNYYFFKQYQTPFVSRFRQRKEPLQKEERVFFWKDEKIRKWNIGLTSSGISIVQKNAVYAQTAPLFTYREFSVVPRFNYWLNQAVLLGIQATYYHYENNYDVPETRTKGFGVGTQARFYPLCFKDPATFRAVRIGKRASWNISPILGVELHVANYSWLDPQTAGEAWQYIDFQPYAGYALSYKRWFNLFVSLGPTLGFGNSNKVSPTNGVRIIGLEYNFSR